MHVLRMPHVATRRHALESAPSRRSTGRLGRVETQTQAATTHTWPGVLASRVLAYKPMRTGRGLCLVVCAIHR